MTTLAPPPASSSPAPRPKPVEPAVRYPAIRANLLPDEVIASRRLAELKKRLGIGMVALLALLVLGYGWSWWQTSSANSDLSAAQRTTNQLQAKQQSYAGVLTAQQQATAIQAALRQLMAGDVQWPHMIEVLGQAAPHGVTIASVQATMTAGAAAASAPGQAGIGVLNQTGQQSVGTLSITGTAPDQRTVAAFVDALATVPGLAAPFPASVGGQAGGAMQFSVNVLITTKALGGRFAAAPAAPANGGK